MVAMGLGWTHEGVTMAVRHRDARPPGGPTSRTARVL